DVLEPDARAALGEDPVAALAVRGRVGPESVLGYGADDRRTGSFGVLQMAIEIIHVDEGCIGSDRAATAPEHDETGPDAELDPGVVRVAFLIRDVGSGFELEHLGEPTCRRRWSGRPDGQMHAAVIDRGTTACPTLEIAREPLRRHADHRQLLGTVDTRGNGAGNADTRPRSVRRERHLDRDVI